MHRLILCTIALLAGAAPCRAFDTFWHIAASGRAVERLGFTDDALNVVQFGNFMPDAYVNLYAHTLGKLKDPALEEQWLGFQQLRKNPRSSAGRNASIFMHFDYLCPKKPDLARCVNDQIPRDSERKLDANWKYDYLLMRLVANAQDVLGGVWRDKSLTDARRKALVLMVLGAAFHMNEDFYSHTNWTHVTPSIRGLDKQTTPWGAARAPTWWEVRDACGPPAAWPVDIASGIYPDPADPSVTRTHQKLNHDNSQLFEHGAQAAAHAIEATVASVAAHQLYAVQTAADANIALFHRIAADPDAKAALLDAGQWQISGKDWILAEVLHWSLGTQMLMSCFTGHWDGPNPPVARATECAGMQAGIQALSMAARAGGPVWGTAATMAGVGAVGMMFYTNFWGLSLEVDYLAALTIGIRSEDDDYAFDRAWYAAHETAQTPASAKRCERLSK